MIMKVESQLTADDARNLTKVKNFSPNKERQKIETIYRVIQAHAIMGRYKCSYLSYISDSNLRHLLESGFKVELAYMPTDRSEFARKYQNKRATANRISWEE